MTQQSMNTVKEMFSDKVTSSLILTNVFLLIITLSAILFFYHNLPPYIPLFNQMPWGTSRIATRSQIIFPFLVTAVLFIINFIVSTSFYKKLPYLVRMGLFTSTFLALLCLMIVLRIFLTVLL